MIVGFGCLRFMKYDSVALSCVNVIALWILRFFLRYTIYDIRNTKMVTEEIVFRYFLPEKKDYGRIKLGADPDNKTDRLFHLACSCSGYLKEKHQL